MATASPFTGRREGIGFGIEATPGTGVASQAWMQWLDQDIQNKTTIIENESALGSVEKINDSAVVERWSEGKIGGKVTSETCGIPTPEWDLMYRKGLTAGRTAAICDARRQTVARPIRERINNDPELDREHVHNLPAGPFPAPNRRGDIFSLGLEPLLQWTFRQLAALHVYVKKARELVHLKILPVT